MVDLDKAVLYFGIASVMAVAVFNHLHAQAAQPEILPPVVVSGALQNFAAVEPERPQPLPATYWTDPATSPLQGVGQGLIRTARPQVLPGPVPAARTTLAEATAGLSIP